MNDIRLRQFHRYGDHARAIIKMPQRLAEFLNATTLRRAGILDESVVEVISDSTNLYEDREALRPAGCRAESRSPRSADLPLRRSGKKARRVPHRRLAARRRSSRAGTSPRAVSDRHRTASFANRRSLGPTRRRRRFSLRWRAIGRRLVRNSARLHYEMKGLELDWQDRNRLIATFDVYTTPAVVLALNAAAGTPASAAYRILQIVQDSSRNDTPYAFEDSAGRRFYHGSQARRECDPAAFTVKLLVNPKVNAKTAIADFFDSISIIARIENAACELSVPLNAVPDRAPECKVLIGAPHK